MKKIMRIISLLICATMLLSSLSISAIAEEIINAPITGDTSENVPNDIPDVIPEPTEGQDNADDAIDSSNESPDDIIGEDSGYSALNAVTYANNVIASGSCGAEGDNVTWQLTDDGVLTISGSGDMADHAFVKNSAIKHVIINEGVTSIGNVAFQNCWYLEWVSIPPSVTKIGDFAFQNNGFMRTITIPGSVETVGAGAFENCTVLYEINIDGLSANYCSVNGILYSVDKSMLIAYPCGKIGSYTIPFYVHSLASDAFAWCAYLTSITIPSSIDVIDDAVFASCTSLTEINVDISNPNYCSVDGVLFTKDMTELIAYPADRKDLSYSIPQGVMSIGTRAFENCTHLEMVEIPDSINYIMFGAFSSCPKLKNVNISKNANGISIGMRAFGYCESLESIVIPKGVQVIYDYAFSGSSNLRTICCEAESKPSEWEDRWNGNEDECWTSPQFADIIWNYGASQIIASGSCGAEGDNVTWRFTDDGVLTISGSGAIADWMELSWEAEQATSIVIEEGITRIGSATLNFKNVNSITMPNSLTSIGAQAFPDCHNLLSITIPAGVTKIDGGGFGCREILVDPNNPAFCSVDGVLFTKDMSTIVAYPSGKEGESYVIPNGVTTVGDSAFQGCQQLKSITIPDGVTEIGSSTFAGCSSLDSIYIPKSVDSIGWSAFADCINLPAIVVDEANSNYCSIDGVLFSGDMLDLLAYPPAKADTSYVIPNGVGRIANNAFGNCKNLTKITISDSVTDIGWWAFSGCDGLNTLVIPKNVSWIGSWAFENCQNLTDIYFRADSQVGEWSSEWNQNASAQIHWGYDGIVDIIASGFCGDQYDNVVWRLTADGVLTISGSGEIADVAESPWVFPWEGFPWEVEDQATSLVIEEGITGLGGNKLFYSFVNLTAIEVAENNPEYCSIDGVLFSKDKSTIYCYPRGKEGESYVIPNGVTTIGGFSFADRPQLRSIIIPEGVTEIGAYAFSGCTGLTSIVLPKTVEQIGGGAFAALAGVEAIELADGCDNYRIVDGVLFTADMSVLLAYPAGKPDTEYNVPNGVTEIGCSSFNISKNLISVVISDDVSFIDFCAFLNCSSLRNVEIPDSVHGISWQAFSDCTSLESIILPRYLGYVGGRIFNGCSSLTDIYCMSDEGQYEWDWDWHKDNEYNEIPAVVHWGSHIHTFSGDWSSNETNHWQVCSCGEKGNISTHEWNSGEVTKPATSTATGIKTYTCTVCNKTKTETIPKLGQENAPNIVVGSANASKGSTVEIPIKFEKNKGITSARLLLTYDTDLLTLTNIKYGSEIISNCQKPQNFDSPVILLWCDAINDFSDELLFATLTFEVSNTAQNDQIAELSISYLEDEIYNVKFDNIYFNVKNGSVKIANHIPGDIDGDGKVNTKDLGILKQYFAGWNVSIDTSALDINGDGSLNTKDLALLKQFFAGWNVTIK